MNSCIILFLLLFCNSNGFGGRNNNECGCDNADSRRGERESDKDSCSCNESRFEPRFESRPFGGSTCGCEEQ